MFRDERDYEHYFFGCSNKNNAGNTATIEQEEKGQGYYSY